MMFASLRYRLDHWALREAPPHVLAVFRIAFGGFLLFYWGLKLRNVPLLFSQRGLILPATEAWWPHAAASLFQAPPLWAAWMLYAAFMLCLLCLALGFRMRLSACLSVLFYGYYWVLSLHLFPTSFDRLFIFTLIVLLFSGADRAFSLRMRLGRGSWLAWEPVSVLPQRLLALQISATYLGVGWQKMVLPDWSGGEMLTYSFLSPWGTALAYWMVRQNWPMWFYDASVMAVMAFEFFMPFGLWWPRVQWFFFLGGLVFHTLIALFLGIWWFLVLIPAYIVFIEPERFFLFLRGCFPSIPAESH